MRNLNRMPKRGVIVLAAALLTIAVASASASRPTANVAAPSTVRMKIAVPRIGGIILAVVKLQVSGTGTPPTAVKLRLARGGRHPGVELLAAEHADLSQTSGTY